MYRFNLLLLIFCQELSGGYQLIGGNYKTFAFVDRHIGSNMTAIPLSEDVVRQRAEWMKPKDDTLLEFLRDRGAYPGTAGLTPKAFEIFEVTGSSYASDRLSELAKYRLVGRHAPGLYYITDKGEAYLDEELDASELDPVDEE